MARGKRAQVLLFVSILIALMLMLRPAVAEETPPAAAAQAAEPQPDPAGIATGTKADAIDAAGNPFVVAEPTDTKDPDYAKKKKDYEEYQEQAAKEPLAVKLADTVGHVRI